MGRAVTPVVAAPILVAITVLLAAVVAVGVLGVPLPNADEPVVLSATVSAPESRIVVTHEGGPRLDVRDLSVRIEVDGTPLAHQPPVPFFSATGFHSGPTGAFNPSADPVLAVGDRASLRVAGTNAPALDPGVRVTIGFYRDDRPVAVVETRVR